MSVDSSTGGGTPTWFLWDGPSLVAEFDSSGVRTKRYAYLGGYAPAQVEDSNGVYYIHADHLDTPRLATNGSGQIVWRSRQEAYGRATVQEDPDGNGALVSINTRFPGQYFDAETGMHYNYRRDYDPAIGRYVQIDPIGMRGGVNLYLYADAAPAAVYDAEGTSATTAPGIRIPGIRVPAPHPLLGALVGGLIIGDAIYGLWGDSISDFIYIMAKGKWTCSASCNVQQIKKDACCPERVTGSASGPSENIACRAAKRAATQSTPPGCYPRHCQCDCYKN